MTGGINARLVVVSEFNKTVGEYEYYTVDHQDSEIYVGILKEFDKKIQRKKDSKDDMILAHVILYSHQLKKIIDYYTLDKKYLPLGKQHLQKTNKKFNHQATIKTI